MESREIYKDIAKRTGGDVYIGVVGPVRCGKSTFINRFMETAVIPNISGEYEKKKARDELPQRAEGKTVMTAEPKFIPDEAVSVTFGEGAQVKIRMIDCVGYLVPGALGMTEDGEERMVKTPWSEDEMPFEKAAREGTAKVIKDHSTIGMLVTCDGTIADIPRESYVEAEEQIVKELRELGKPFVMILNSRDPSTESAEKLAIELENKYHCPVALVNCLELNRDDIESIIEMLLYEFPITELKVRLPSWITAVPDNHRIKEILKKIIKKNAPVLQTLNGLREFSDTVEKEISAALKEEGNTLRIGTTDLSRGVAEVYVDLCDSVYYSTVRDLTGLDISSEKELISVLLELSGAREELCKYKDALEQLESGGYGIVMPKIEDLTIDEPEVIRSSGAYGVKLRAKAESIHMIKAAIETEINPIVGTQEQAEEIIQRLISEYEDDPGKLWDSNIFGKSLYELVNDGLNTKIEHLSPQSREKLSETLSRIVNESSNGLICILL